MFVWTAAHKTRLNRLVEPSGVFDGGISGTRSGLLAGTRVATTMGWRPVEGLAPGDMVLTFDAGLQPITGISRTPVWTGQAQPPRAFWPLHIPMGALGNRVALDVLPHQYLMIESDAGELLFGDPFSLIKAETLDGVNGIGPRQIPPGQEAIVLHFDEDQIIFDQSGILFFSPSALGLTGVVAPAYDALTEADADALITCIESDLAAGQLCAPVLESETFAAA